jgi:hypothetical protein
MSTATLLQVEERIRLLALVASDADRVAGPSQCPYPFVKRCRVCMNDFGVCKLVQLPPGKNVMSCKWVYDIKRC